MNSLLLAVVLAAPPVDEAFFESNVRPLLTTHCTGCHGPAKQKGGLRLDSRKLATAGGDTGPAMVAGDAAKSLLVKAVRYADDLKMPPKGKLSADEIDILERWVAGGAPWPDVSGVTVAGPKGFDVKAVAAGYWAYQPVRTTEPPTVRDANWPKGDIDRFVLAKLEAAGLKPAEQSDRTTLIRRLTFDLIGLPPTPAEIDAFLADQSPDAYEKLVDRLLSSSHYGERWGRHWLDLVRYADTYGHEFDPDIPDAWRYRDYVIAAFNGDLPFDRFAREQIAGDLIPHARPEIKIGTGFWLLGEAKHSPVDVRQDQAERIDNMIDVFGKTFLGHTVACARCHDHKFDPVSAKDYYALYGILSSSRPTRTWLGDDKPPTPAGKWAGWSLDGPAFTQTDEIDSGRNGELHGGAVRSPTFRIGTRFVAVRVAGKSTKLRLVLDGLQLIQAPIYGGLARGIDSDDYYWVGIDVNMWPGHAAYLELIDDGPGHFALDEVRFTDRIPTDKPTPGPKPATTDVKSPPRAYVMADGTGLNERVFVRGNHKTLGEEVPRRFLELFAGTAGASTGSGRKELADAVTDSANPLTARVFVNRVWQHHFGTGLVPTPDDFGRQGTPPTHPELLDFLAAEFVRDGWKVKALHRRMLLSATYRMSSRPHPATADLATSVDPQNRLLHKATVRRLEAEAIRDAILLVSGRLDRTPGGPGVMPHLTDHMVGRGRPASSGPLDGDGRRSVYLQTRRNFLNPMFAAFDFPTPFTTIGRRGASNVPAQGLVMLNNPFVCGQAEAWAKRESGDPADRVRLMYRSALGRLPGDDEVSTATRFVADHPGDGWVALAHALFNAKEFLFVE